MVTPDRRRRAVMVLRERFGVSERRACRVVGQHRSTQRRPVRPEPVEDENLRRRLRHFARRHPRLGWRKAYVVLRREGGFRGQPQEDPTIMTRRGPETASATEEQETPTRNLGGDLTGPRQWRLNVPRA